MGQILRIDPETAVTDRDLRIKGIIHAGYLQRFPVGRIFQTVLHHIADCLQSPCLIRGKCHPFRTFNPAPLIPQIHLDLKRLHHFLQEAFHRNVCRLQTDRAGVQLRYFQKGRDQPLDPLQHPVHFSQNPFSLLRIIPFLHHPCCHQVQGRQRCPDLMGDICKRVRQSLLIFSQCLRLLPEAHGHLVDLIPEDRYLPFLITAQYQFPATMQDPVHLTAEPPERLFIFSHLIHIDPAEEQCCCSGGQ